MATSISQNQMTRLIGLSSKLVDTFIPSVWRILQGLFLKNFRLIYRTFQMRFFFLQKLTKIRSVIWLKMEKKFQIDDIFQVKKNNDQVKMNSRIFHFWHIFARVSFRIILILLMQGVVVELIVKNQKYISQMVFYITICTFANSYHIKRGGGIES